MYKHIYDNATPTVYYFNLLKRRMTKIEKRSTAQLMFISLYYLPCMLHHFSTFYL